MGAGHAHAIVLERWAKSERPDADITVVTNGETTLYSGMIPGWIAGEYERSELELDARLMARRAGASLVIDRVASVDAVERVLILDDGTPVPYDIASLDVGSQVGSPTGMSGPSHVSARDPGRIIAALSVDPDRSVVVVGGGAAGVELAACTRARIRGSVTLVEAGTRLMGSHDGRVSDRVQAALEARSVSVRLGTSASPGLQDDEPAGRVEGSGAREAHVDGDARGDGEPRSADPLTIWATGARGPDLLAESKLPLDDRGFVRVEDTLQVTGHERLFAAGDCASRDNDPTPKAGFHAIEQGEALAGNLAASVAAWPDRPSELDGYAPRSDFLTLLNLGDGHALGTKWGLAAEGRWVRTLKDAIDRRFVRRFQ
ncbi:MAG: FAD-dependent oxidoreductase [Gemmatimonadetes bacterium]|nr:FAD-dependent oxidoreductase [Gemmatimonadota bacterium]